MNKSLLILIQIVVATLYATNAAPTTTATATNTETTLQTQNATEVQLVQAPQVVTLAHLESLLKRAGEIFRPAIYQTMAEQAEQAEQAQEQEQTQEAPQQQQQQQQQQVQIVPTFVAVPFEYMQPPNDQPYNYYLPLYDHSGENDERAQKLDAKSSKFAKITPPPKSASVQPNYYAMKPKKVAKKFNAAHKHINMKWLNAYEKETGLELPKESYLVNDERNRINFDDSFFAVDMLVKAPATNEQPKTAADTSGISQQQDDYQTEEGEDLMAAAAAQVTQISVA